MTLHQTETPAASAPGSPSTANAKAETTPQRPASARGFSMRPAMIVLGLAVLIVGLFVTIGIVSTHEPATVKTSVATSRVPGSALRAQAAAGPLSVIRQAGDPPANILNAVVIPVGSTRVAHHANPGSQYDEQVTFRSDASQAALLAFFTGAMRQEGWQIFDRGPAAHAAPGTTEILGKLAGSDGYYWEMGAIVAPTSFGHGTPSTGTTDFTVRLFQVADTQ